MQVGFFFFILFALPLTSWADREPYILWDGPSSVVGIPLEPPQTVEAWYALYTDRVTKIVVYVTRSPYLIPPASTRETRGFRVAMGAEGSLALWPDSVLPGGWEWIVFVPADWSREAQSSWLTAFAAEAARLPKTVPGKLRPILPAVVAPR